MRLIRRLGIALSVLAIVYITATAGLIYRNAAAAGTLRRNHVEGSHGRR